MDTVVLDGVEYVKASVLAKKFRYTPDYIGQLCRAKKIDARLVGRSWFVNPESINGHKLKKYKSTPKTSDGHPDITSKKKPSRKVVLPVIQNKTAKSTANVPIEVDGVQIRKLAVAYEPDDETLIPKLTKKKVGPAKIIRIEQVNAKKIKVKGEKKQASFHAEELPEVSLSGKLKITSFSDPKLEIVEADTKNINTEKDVKNTAIPPKLNVGVKKPKVEEVTSFSVVTPKNINNGEKTKRSQAHIVTKSIQAQPVPKIANAESPVVSSFTPAQLKNETSTMVLISPLIATLLAFLCVLFILSASTRVVVFESVYESKVTLHMANLLEIFNQ